MLQCKFSACFRAANGRGFTEVLKLKNYIENGYASTAHCRLPSGQRDWVA